MIVDQAVYRDGKRLQCGDLSDELDQLHKEKAGFLWIGLKDPTLEEFDLVKDELDLHPLAVEDAVTGDQRPKVERYPNGNLFVVMKTLSYVEETSDVETGEVMLFIGERFAVTVRRGEPAPLAPVRAALEHAPELLAHGPVAVLYSVMDAVVDNYMRIDDELADDLDRIERDVFSADRTTNVQEIYSLKREVLETRRAALPLVEPLMRMLKAGLLPKEALPFFRDINDHLLRVVDHIETYDRLLTDVLNAHLAQVSVQQNGDMRKISAWVAVAAFPTMVAGIYGMNFSGMPELTASFDIGGSEYYYGYFVVLAFIVVGCVFIYRAFKKSGWL
ncbi:magnesium and cobalt transport protein CorA [Luteipulveratus mongoliensis]|uniref:Magnesium transporter CorA n=1 Tax=Luteipulveratus mongoliensis TaxID=571913 RepID=A0A0K1JJY8_9MICO|nr:magnesium and cobalt transport protein CorA [Luteipulveratus mongoliensis]AKU17021.1 magnesium transporter CorA [Luteipulveratus mongoliensis]